MFKDKLRELREKEKLSQYELADKIFVSRSAVAKWESGNGIPSDVNLEALCQFFNVEEEWLLDRKDLKRALRESNYKEKVTVILLGVLTSILMLTGVVLVILHFTNEIPLGIGSLFGTTAAIVNLIMIFKNRKIKI